MKKTLSVILAVVILLSGIFCVTAFASEAPKTDALLESLNNSTEVSVGLKSEGKAFLGLIPRNATNTVAIKDGAVAYEYSSGILTVKIVSVDGEIYGFLPKLPFFYVKLDTLPVSGDNIWAMIKGAVNLTQGSIEYLRSYNETVDETEYLVEEYTGSQNELNRFFYLGDDLKMIEAANAMTGAVKTTYFEDISFEAEDSFFEVPVFAVDLTPLLKGLFLSILASFGSTVLA